MGFILYSYMAYKTSKIMYMYTHIVFFNYMFLHFVFFMISCTFLFCPGHMPIIPIRTMFPDFMPFYGGTHKTKKTGV